ncbi:MAG: hypothetical protein ACRC1H_04520, partial [Caldilineaceae bacterium]
DPTGGLHAAWSGADDAFDFTVYSSSRDGQSWSAPVDIVAMRLGPNGESYVSRPVLSAGPDGALLLGHHGQEDESFLYTSTFDMATSPFAWDRGERLHSGYHTVPVAADDGAAHLVTTEFGNSLQCDRCLQLLYRYRAGAADDWSAPVEVSRDPARGSAKPSLLVDGESLYLTWESGFDGNRGYVGGPAAAMFSLSRNGGRTWSQPIALDTTAAAPQPAGTSSNASGALRTARNVALGIDGAGNLVAAWWRMPENVIAFRYSRDGGENWSEPQTIPGVWGVGNRSMTDQDRYVMAQDAAGGLHLLAVGGRSPDVAELALLHLRWEGTAWSQPETIVTSRSDLIEWPDAIVRLGNELHVTWHVRPNALVADGDPPPFAVWHSSRIVEAPALAPIVLPTSPAPRLPQPSTPPPPATSTPSPTPRPMLAPATNQQGLTSAAETPFIQLPNNIRSENDEVVMIALALLPVAALVGVVLLGLARRRSRR